MSPGSDPYCVFVLGDEEVKSKVVMGTSTPRWDDEFFMSVPDTRYYLRCLLYDRGRPTTSSQISNNSEPYATVCGLVGVSLIRCGSPQMRAQRWKMTS